MSVLHTSMHKKLRAHWGSITELSKRTGYSRQHIHAVFTGSYTNWEIMDAAAVLLKELESKRARRIASIQRSITHAERVAESTN